MDNVWSHFLTRQRQKAIVRRYFQTPPVRCAAFYYGEKMALSIALKPTANVAGFLHYQIVEVHLQMDNTA